jgi:hypothetical protein
LRALKRSSLTGYLKLKSTIESSVNNQRLLVTLPDVKSIAKQYLALSNAVDYNGRADLFAEEAEWVPISLIEPRTGREAIRAGYLNHVKSENRLISNVRHYADGLTWVVEFDVQLEAGEIASVDDIFTFNECGEISRIASYKQ